MNSFTGMHISDPLRDTDCVRYLILLWVLVGGALAFFSLMTIIWRGVDDLGWSGVIYVLVYAASVLVIFKNKRVHDFVDRSLDLDEPT